MRELLFKLLGALILAASLILGWLWMDSQSYMDRPLPVGGAGETFILDPGTPLRGMTGELARRHILTKPSYVYWLVRLQGLAREIHAGEYRVEPGMTPRELIEKMVRGDVVQHSLTLVEGWTFHQVMATVGAEPDLRHTLTGLDDAAIMAQLGHPGVNPEGRFFPDTYRFPRGTTDVAFLQRAYDEMSRRLTAAWDERENGLPLKDPYQALILASIVEKETAVARERPRIAGVFIRRLERGMRLQTDPAVIYGLGSSFDGNIHRRDLKRDTPYNTYLHKGLPPTPIAMPGEASLQAAIHPANGGALYFVSRGDGSHQFSATLEEHNRAVVKYQLKR